MRILTLITLATVAVFGSGCTTYVGIAKADSQVFLTGTTSFFFSTSWVKRCNEVGAELRCENLKVVTQKNSSSATDTSVRKKVNESGD